MHSIFVILGLKKRHCNSNYQFLVYLFINTYSGRINGNLQGEAKKKQERDNLKPLSFKGKTTSKLAKWVHNLVK